MLMRRNLRMWLESSSSSKLRFRGLARPKDFFPLELLPANGPFVKELSEGSGELPISSMRREMIAPQRSLDVLDAVT
jgi:hypothetical protein